MPLGVHNPEDYGVPVRRRTLDRAERQEKAMQLPIAVATAVVALTLFSLNNNTVWASPLTEDARTALVKSAEESCFHGQSKQEANKARKAVALHTVRYCSPA